MTPADNSLFVSISRLYDMQENTTVQFYSPGNCRGACRYLKLLIQLLHFLQLFNCWCYFAWSVYFYFTVLYYNYTSVNAFFNCAVQCMCAHTFCFKMVPSQELFIPFPIEILQQKLRPHIIMHIGLKFYSRSHQFNYTSGCIWFNIDFIIDKFSFTLSPLAITTQSGF